ncbi:MAG: hypothetical protein ACI9CF_001446 [Candidatus Omnitrophota bacterium]|jgi:hypothetical protein
MSEYKCPICNSSKSPDDVFFGGASTTSIICCKSCSKGFLDDHSTINKNPLLATRLAFRRVLQDIKGIEIVSVQLNDPARHELTFKKSDLDEWNEALKKVFGPIAKNIGEECDAEQKKACRPHGGIRKHQILYMKKFVSHTLIAMIWQWADRDLASLKLIVEPQPR